MTGTTYIRQLPRYTKKNERQRNNNKKITIKKKHTKEKEIMLNRETEQERRSKYSEKIKRRAKKTPTGGRTILRAYSRIVVVPLHRVAVVYPFVEVMRQAVQ